MSGSMYSMRGSHIHVQSAAVGSMSWSIQSLSGYTCMVIGLWSFVGCCGREGGDWVVYDVGCERAKVKLRS